MTPMDADFETDDLNGTACESCLAQTDAVLRSIGCEPEGAVISYDARSGRHLCSSCEPHPLAIDR